MSDDSVNRIVSRLAQGAPESARLQEVLSTSFKQTDENPYWTFHAFELKEGPFAGGEFRQSKEGGKALLSLTVRGDAPVSESDLDLGQWGEVRNITSSPRIPPEGADAYVYAVDGTQVSFQFTHASRQLRTVAIEW